MIGLPMDLAFSAPKPWGDGLDDDVLQRSSISDDFCEIIYDDQTDRFIRVVLPIRVIGLGEEFRFGVWVSVSEASWDIYKQGFATGVYQSEACFGFLANEIGGFPGAFLLHADVLFQPGNQRPIVELHDADHPLVEAQRYGVTIETVEGWIAKGTSH